MNDRERVTRQAQRRKEESGRDPTDSETTKPALDKLHRDQQEILHLGNATRDPPIRPLSDGFETYYQLLCWYQAAGVRTLGRVPDMIGAESLVPESSLSRYLTTPGTEASQVVIETLTERLQSACTDAYREFQTRAEERTGSGSDSEQAGYESIDVTNEDNPGMRPGFRKLDAAQSDRLRECWVGFESRRELEEWVGSLKPATLGGQPSDLLDQITRSDTLVRHLTTPQGDESQLVRLRFLIAAVLPEFAAAARRVTGSEKSQGTTDTGGWKNA